MFKTAARLILSAILLILTGLMVAFAHYTPAAVFAWYPALSQSLLSTMGKVTSALPFSLAEVLLVLLLLWTVYSFTGIFRHVTGPLRWLSGLLEGAGIIVFLFMAIWGLNYFNPASVGDALGMNVGTYSAEELQDATEYYLAQANDYARRMERNADGTTAAVPFRALAERTAAGYDVLAAQYSRFQPSTQTPKPVLASSAMSYSGITGIFLCLTAECNVNDDGPAWTLPYTMCHERAHAQGVAPENECNFVGYLACVASGDDLLAYSGSYHALIYCYNALYQIDRDAAADVWARLDPGLEADIRAANAHYARFQGEVQKVAEKVNDTYLKTMEQHSGVQSYGEVVDYLIAWYQMQG